MEKPVKRTEYELPDNFVDYLYATYEPQRNSAGEYYFNGLDYLTNEMSYMSSETEKEFVEEYGLAPIAFLELLRVQMAKSPQGFGLCINDKSLKKAIANIAIDYDLDLAELQEYQRQLQESHLLIIITDSNGNGYATTMQQIFNWEYKMWSRWTNCEYQRKRRKKAGNQEKDEEEPVEEPETETPPPPPKITPFDETFMTDIGEEEFFSV